MKKRTKVGINFLIFLGVIVLWVAIFRYLNPQLIVAKIGVTNGYLVLLLIGAIGGVSVFTGPSYFIALTTLSVVGLNPLLLGLAGGAGVTIGDTIMFFLGINAGSKAPEKFRTKLNKLEKKIETKPKWLVNLITYSYIAFTPFPNEVVTISLGLIGYKKRLILPILFLGNITSGILGAVLIRYGIDFLHLSF